VNRDRVRGDLAASLDHFIRAVLDGRPPDVTLEMARNAHAIVDAAKRSAASNQPVSLAPPG
jgi:predicted dehydrogenase